MQRVYDGSFEGLLNAIAVAAKSNRTTDGIFSAHQYAPQLFEKPLRLETNPDQAVRLFRYLNALKNPAAQFVVNAFLSEDPGIGIHLLRLVRQCLKLGAKATLQYNHDSIRYLGRRSRQVSREAHKYKGLIRFSIMRKGLQYAPFEPQANVIGYCARHFQKRLAHQQWILHDVGRDLALLWDTKTIQNIAIDSDFTFYVRQNGLPPCAELDADETHYRRLWKLFHTAVANKKRQNRRLQHQFIPQRYWKYLVETDP